MRASTVRIMQPFRESLKSIRDIVGAKECAEPLSVHYRSLHTDPNCVRVMFDFDKNLT